MSSYIAPSRLDPENHQRGASKFARIPVKVITSDNPLPRKPRWIRARAHTHPRVKAIKKIMREQNLHSVCEEANCPNLGECFSHGTATFIVMGDICTRRCPFCDVAHGRPNPLDADEPRRLGKTIALMGLSYVVITSVDRDDLRDGGAAHIADCVTQTRAANPDIRVEILVPDFRGRMEKALDALAISPSDVFNHNLETVPRLYRAVRPGSDYQWSLNLLQAHRERFPAIPTKSGLMLGLGEELDEVRQVMRDLRTHGVEMLTLGQYLQPSREHFPVARFVTPDEFDQLAVDGEAMGFTHVASGPMVRSSYHADIQASGVIPG